MIRGLVKAPVRPGRFSPCPKPRNPVSDLLLLLAAMIWGLSFVAQRAGMEYVGPFTLQRGPIALGFRVAVCRSLWWRGTVPVRRLPFPSGSRIGALRAGLIAGLVLLRGILPPADRAVSTTAEGGFITGLYVVLVPLGGLLRGQPAGMEPVDRAILSGGRTFLLTVTTVSACVGDSWFSSAPFSGPRHIHAGRRAVAAHRPVALAAAVRGLLHAEPPGGGLTRSSLTSCCALPSADRLRRPGLRGLAFTLQVVVQRTAHPAHTAILLSLERVFAALGGSILLGEHLGMRGTAGCAIMFAGMIVSQIPLLSSSLGLTGPR